MWSFANETSRLYWCYDGRKQSFFPWGTAVLLQYMFHTYLNSLAWVLARPSMTLSGSFTLTPVYVHISASHGVIIGTNAEFSLGVYCCLQIRIKHWIHVFTRRTVLSKPTAGEGMNSAPTRFELSFKWLKAESPAFKNQAPTISSIYMPTWKHDWAHALIGKIYVLWKTIWS